MRGGGVRTPEVLVRVAGEVFWSFFVVVVSTSLSISWVAITACTLCFSAEMC